MGKLGQIMDTRLWERISNAAKQVEAVGRPVVMLVMDPAKASTSLNDGFTFVACGSGTGVRNTSQDSWTLA